MVPLILRFESLLLVPNSAIFVIIMRVALLDKLFKEISKLLRPVCLEIISARSSTLLNLSSLVCPYTSPSQNQEVFSLILRSVIESMFELWRASRMSSHMFSFCYSLPLNFSRFRTSIGGLLCIICKNRLAIDSLSSPDSE